MNSINSHLENKSQEERSYLLMFYLSRKLALFLTVKYFAKISAP